MLTLASILIAAGVATAAETIVALNKVPAKVKEASAKLMPGAKFAKATQDVENEWFRLRGKDGEGRAIEVFCSKDLATIRGLTFIPIGLDEVALNAKVVHEGLMKQDGPTAIRATDAFRVEESKPELDFKPIYYEYRGKGKKGKSFFHRYDSTGVPVRDGPLGD